MKKNSSPSPFVRSIPYLVAVALFVATALLIPVFRQMAADGGYLTEQSQANVLLTHLPLAAGYLLIAYAVSKLLFRQEKQSGKDETKTAMIWAALAVVCLVFGAGFATSFDVIKGNKIIHKGAFFTKRGWSVVLESTPWELTDDDIYVLQFENRTVRIAKYSDAGKELEKTLFPKG